MKVFIRVTDITKVNVSLNVDHIISMCELEDPDGKKYTNITLKDTMTVYTLTSVDDLERAINNAQREKN